MVRVDTSVIIVQIASVLKGWKEITESTKTLHKEDMADIPQRLYEAMRQ